MKVILDVKGKKALYPQSNDVVVYNGRDYYVTTIDDILSKANNIMENCKKEIEILRLEKEELKKQNENYKKEVAEQLLSMSKIIESLMESK